MSTRALIVVLRLKFSKQGLLLGMVRLMEAGKRDLVRV